MEVLERGEEGRNGGATLSIIEDEYVTPDSLARSLGVSVRTLDRWNAKRSGPPRTVVGRTILYRRESVQEWLRSREERRQARHGRRRAQ